MSKRFTPAKRPTPDIIANRYGLYGTQLFDICSYDGKPPNGNQVVEFFLRARTQTEKKALETLRPDIEAETNARIVFSGYEWITFSLPGGSYTPDWCFLLDNGKWVRVEIKASKMQPGYKDARSKLRAAASLNPWDLFYEYRRRRVIDGGGWILELVPPSPRWLQNLDQAYKNWGFQQDMNS